MNDQILDRIRKDKKARAQLFNALAPAERSQALLAVSPRIQSNLLASLANADVIEVFNQLDPDQVTGLLRRLEKKRERQIVQQLSQGMREKVEFLLKFDPNTAADLMSLDYIQVDAGTTFGDIKNDIIEHEKLTGKFPIILVMEDGKVIGELPGHALVTKSATEKTAAHARRPVTVKYNSDPHKVIDTFLQHPHNKVVVLNDDGSVIGVIHSDDVLRYIEKRPARDLYGFAGVNREEHVNDGMWQKVRYRYKWLIINLGTAFLAASVVSTFEETIARVVLLAVYMPIVAGMGGNAATQTLAVVVRGIVTKEVDLKSAGPVIRKEVGAGFINGLINGVLVAAVAIIWNHNPIFGFVIGLAMIINLVIAGFFGALIPVVMKALKQDPAASATIFITTATDVFGFFAFLGLATILL
jgi:magnesium transporter